MSGHCSHGTQRGAADCVDCAAGGNFGFAVLVVRPIGTNTLTADAYGCHGEMEAHDIAVVAARAGQAAFLVRLDDRVVERYQAEDL